MKELTDEQYAKIGNLVYDLGWSGIAEGVSRGNTRLGRAAVAAVAPLVVEEALGLVNAEENYAARVAYEETRNLCQAIHRVFDLRRARLTAKPDPRVQIVKNVLEMIMLRSCKWGAEKDAELILAELDKAVDEARKGAK